MHLHVLRNCVLAWLQVCSGILDGVQGVHAAGLHHHEEEQPSLHLPPWPGSSIYCLCCEHPHASSHASVQYIVSMCPQGSMAGLLLCRLMIQVVPTGIMTQTCSCPLACLFAMHSQRVSTKLACGCSPNNSAIAVLQPCYAVACSSSTFEGPCLQWQGTSWKVFRNAGSGARYRKYCTARIALQQRL